MSNGNRKLRHNTLRVPVVGTVFPLTPREYWRVPEMREGFEDDLRQVPLMFATLGLASDAHNSLCWNRHCQLSCVPDSGFSCRIFPKHSARKLLRSKFTKHLMPLHLSHSFNYGMQLVLYFTSHQNRSATKKI